MRAVLWFIWTCSFVPCIQSQGIFVHAVMVDGKPTMVSTHVNSSFFLDNNTPKRHKTGSKTAKFEIPLSSADEKWLGSLLYIPEKDDTRIRKEYRELSTNERDNLNLAFNMLKNNTSVSLNKYDLLANIHARSSANANAHNGPNFPGWHRVFLLMVENALRQEVKSVTLPYWDVTLDEAMDKPYNSVIWSDDFMGGGEGAVRSGPFGHWETQFGYGHLRRILAGQGKLMSKQDVGNILSQRRLGDITNPRANRTFNIEEIHNDVHVWIGGQMKTIEIAAFDPIFYLFHAFTDNIWTEFREQQKVDGIDPTSDYPQYYGRSTHSPFAPMALGTVMVLDGISDIWNENVRYSPRPTCNKTYNGCTSPFLKCDATKGICISKSIIEVENQNQPFKLTPTDTNKNGGSINKKIINYKVSVNEQEREQNVTDAFETMYIRHTELFNLSNFTIYRKFQAQKSSVSPVGSLYQTVKVSDVYQFYSVLSADHTDVVNLTLLFIYIGVFHLRHEVH